MEMSLPVGSPIVLSWMVAEDALEQSPRDWTATATPAAMPAQRALALATSRSVGAMNGHDPVLEQHDDDSYSHSHMPISPGAMSASSDLSLASSEASSTRASRSSSISTSRSASFAAAHGITIALPNTSSSSSSSTTTTTTLFERIHRLAGGWSPDASDVTPVVPHTRVPGLADENNTNSRIVRRQDQSSRPSRLTRPPSRPARPSRPSRPSRPTPSSINGSHSNGAQRRLASSLNGGSSSLLVSSNVTVPVESFSTAFLPSNGDDDNPNNYSDDFMYNNNDTLPDPTTITGTTPSSSPTSAWTWTPEYRTELRSLVAVAWPISLSILFRMAMSVTDMAIVGHVGVAYLEAASAALIWMNITSAALYYGLGTAVNTLCSQAFGAGKLELVGLWYQQSLVMATLLSAPLAALWWFTGDALHLFGFNASILDSATVFARYSCLGIWPTMMYECTTRYFQAQQIVYPALIVNVIMCAANVALNYIFVFGTGSALSTDFDGWGFVGSPLATAACRWLLLILFVLYAFVWQRLHRPTWPGGWSWACIRRDRVRTFMCSQALPLMLGICLEEWQLEVVAVFAGHLGDKQLAAHNSMLEIFMLFTSVMLGLMAAAVVRIGAHLGSGDTGAARRASHVAFGCALVPGVLTAVLFIVLRQYIGLVYSNDETVREYAASISIIVGSCYLLLSVFYTSMSVLDAQARPNLVAAAFLFGAWIVAVPSAYAFGFPLGLGLDGLWYGLVVGYFTVTLIVTFAAAKSDWERYALEAVRRSEAAMLDSEQVGRESDPFVTSGGGLGSSSEERSSAFVRMEDEPPAARVHVVVKKGEDDDDDEADEDDEEDEYRYRDSDHALHDAAMLSGLEDGPASPPPVADGSRYAKMVQSMQRRGGS